MGCFRTALVLQAATHPFPHRVNCRGFVSWLTVATGTAPSCLWGGFLSHKAFLIGHDRSFWLPDLIYTSLQNICCSASLHRVPSCALLKVVEVSTRGSCGSVTTDKGRKTNVCNTRKCAKMFALKGDCMIRKIVTALIPFLFSLHFLSEIGRVFSTIDVAVRQRNITADMFGLPEQ